MICEFICFFVLKQYTKYINTIKCTLGQKKTRYPIYFNANYRTEMKLVSIIMDYCLLQFDALYFFLGVHLHRGSLPNFIFSM